MSFTITHEFADIRNSAISESVSFGLSQWWLHVSASNDYSGLYLYHKGPPTNIQTSVTIGPTKWVFNRLMNNDNWGWNEIFDHKTYGNQKVKVECKITVERFFPVDLIQATYNDDTCDFAIDTEGYNFPVHKYNLSMYSSVLKNMLHSTMQETITNTLTLDDVSHQVVDTFVKLMYQQPVDLSTVSIADKIELFKLTNKYSATFIESCVEEDLEKSLSVDNCLTIFVAADQIGKQSLKEKTLQYMKTNVKEVIARHEFTMHDILGPLTVELFKVVNS